MNARMTEQQLETAVLYKSSGAFRGIKKPGAKISFLEAGIYSTSGTSGALYHLGSVSHMPQGILQPGTCYSARMAGQNICAC